MIHILLLYIYIMYVYKTDGSCEYVMIAGAGHRGCNTPALQDPLTEPWEGHRRPPGNNYDAMAEPMIPAESSSSQQNYQRVSYLELPEAKVCVSKTCQLLESFQNWVNQLLRCAHRQKVEFYELYDSGFKLHGVPLPKVHV